MSCLSSTTWSLTWGIIMIQLQESLPALSLGFISLLIMCWCGVETVPACGQTSAKTTRWDFTHSVCKKQFINNILCLNVLIRGVVNTWDQIFSDQCSFPVFICPFCFFALFLYPLINSKVFPHVDVKHPSVCLWLLLLLLFTTTTTTTTTTIVVVVEIIFVINNV